MAQTSIEWLIEQLKEYDFADIKDSENYIIKIPAWILTEKEEQSKQMHKQEIIDASIHTVQYNENLTLESGLLIAKKYYQDTFKKD